jgi:hypothetical protein
MTKRTDDEEQGRILRVLRLSEAADEMLRAYTSRKGDVSLQVNHALLGTDLEKIEVIPRSRAPGGRQTYKSTSVTFEPGVYPMVQRIAAMRNISATSLIDAAIIQFFKPRAAERVHHVESDSSNGDKPKRRRR